MTLEHAIMIALFGLGICGLCYVWSTEADRLLGERLRCEYEIRREQLQSSMTATELAHQHVNDLAFERQAMASRPWDSIPVNRASAPSTLPRPRLRLVKSNVVPIRRSRTPDDAA